MSLPGFIKYQDCVLKTGSVPVKTGQMTTLINKRYTMKIISRHYCIINLQISDKIILKIKKSIN